MNIFGSPFFDLFLSFDLLFLTILVAAFFSLSLSSLKTCSSTMRFLMVSRTSVGEIPSLFFLGSLGSSSFIRSSFYVAMITTKINCFQFVTIIVLLFFSLNIEHILIKHFSPCLRSNCCNHTICNVPQMYQIKKKFLGTLNLFLFEQLISKDLLLL